MTSQSVRDCKTEELRIAFDLDAVLFSPESEVHYKAGGLKAFFRHEYENADKLVEEVWDGLYHGRKHQPCCLLICMPHLE